MKDFRENRRNKKWKTIKKKEAIKRTKNWKIRGAKVSGKTT